MREWKERAPLMRFPLRSRLVGRASRIIVAGSGPQERKELRIALEPEGYQVVESETVDDTLQVACSGMHHALILAARFEGKEPYEFCRTIRLHSDLGIIVLADADEKQCLIDALNAGADDFLTSPIVPRELLARLRAVLRRVSRFDEEGHQIILQDRTIDLRSHKIKGPGGRVSRLTPKECLVLQCLVNHVNKVFTHQNLAQTVWQRDGLGEVEYMRVVIRQLRRKLEPDPDNPRFILTERSIGYRFHMPTAAGQGLATEPSPRLSLVG
jgi:two-component system, OmpR family, KDP operon response regulator KdpE